MTSVGLAYGDPLAGFRALFDISSRLLRRTLAYGRALRLKIAFGEELRAGIAVQRPADLRLDLAHSGDGDREALADAEVGVGLMRQPSSEKSVSLTGALLPSSRWTTASSATAAGPCGLSNHACAARRQPPLSYAGVLSHLGKID